MLSLVRCVLNKWIISVKIDNPTKDAANVARKENKQPIKCMTKAVHSQICKKI
jgi:hypothetical protein